MRAVATEYGLGIGVEQAIIRVAEAIQFYPRDFLTDKPLNGSDLLQITLDDHNCPASVRVPETMVGNTDDLPALNIYIR